MLQIDDLHATIADKPTLKALSLTINAGEIHAIRGPSGAAKSTLRVSVSASEAAC